MNMRIRISDETNQALAMKRCGSLLRGWCVRCGKQTGMVRLEEAALAGMSLQGICHQAKADRLHLITTAGAVLFICLNSLLEEQWKKDRVGSDEVLEVAASSHRHSRELWRWREHKEN